MEIYDGEYVEITGLVEEIAFRNEENSYTVMDISSSNELVTAVGVMPEISPGETVQLTGYWSQHRSYGKQFNVKRIERYLPESAAGYLKYLSSGTISGIGPKTAQKIVERFGEATFDVIENEPERLCVIRGISKDKAKLISAQFRKQFEIRTIMIELEKYGFSPSECIRIHKKLGVNAIEEVRMNPYILCGILDSYNFERAEKTAALMPEKCEPRHRFTAGIQYILSHNTFANGHTCLPYDKVLMLSCQMMNASDIDIDKTIADMVHNKMLFETTVGPKKFLSQRDIYLDEKKVADRLKLFMLYSSLSVDTDESIIDEIEKENDIKYEKIQREAIMTAADNGVLILTGGPGTGKTTTVRGIISFFEQKGQSILLAAPTGRAAKRMTELTGRESKTIHRLLEVEWTDEDVSSFKRNSTNPLEADVVIIDEVSMIDVSLFASLLDAIKFGCRLILVGDSDQLPAVGAGNCLSDIISSEKIPVIKLEQVFRQSQQSLIVTNAHAIIEGGNVDLDRHDSDFFFMQRNSSFDAAELCVELCRDRLPKAYGYDPISDIQVLCPSKKGDCGTVNMNRRLQESLNPLTDDEPNSRIEKQEIHLAGEPNARRNAKVGSFNDKQSARVEKKEIHLAGKLFREGDKVMQIKNNYDILWEKTDNDETEQGNGLFNGDVGIIEELDTKGETMKIVFDENKRVNYPFAYANELDLSYAVTVHKSQGSEYNAVILPIIDVPPRLLYRNLLYTAITRAKKQIIIVGKAEIIQKMIDNNRQNKRYSLLREMLQEEY